MPGPLAGTFVLGARMLNVSGFSLLLDPRKGAAALRA